MPSDLVGIWHVSKIRGDKVTLLAATSDNTGFYFEDPWFPYTIWTTPLKDLRESHLKIAPGVLTKW